ncbi:MAG: NADH-quinone oxidoreductase subunit L [Phycisphaerae bacterium]|nr:NADH-quinone oxidoreductase subunit L [Phycisphaerae bacterium]
MPDHSYELLLTLGVLSPMVSFWLLVFFGPKMGKPAAGWLAVALGMGVPLALATYVLVGWWGEVHAGTAAQLSHDALRFHWADLGGVPINVGVKLDSLTVAMYFMVTFVAFWIFVFSVGYMSGHSDEVDGQSKYSRFFAYLSLFGFSMLGLVISSSLLFLFIFWELVGLCSYLLIGFYFDRPYASRAAIKAFVTNRFGDFGFLIGLMLVFFQLRTLDLDQAATVFRDQYIAGTGIFASSFTFLGLSLATIMGIGLFCGAMGKSAQFPLHVWLPDAMAGPTPVSALIHAATMVAAGVYLVARVFRLMTPEALLFVAAIGCLTLTLMALVAIVQTDIKKCLAYSTLSQLGYMIFGMGCGAWIAALFHLITHAFFKAMLFLCSGQVIEGCHHEQDMRKMGGLRKKMPVTCWTFFVGVLAISGAGIAGTKIGLGGFFSKDEILAVAYARAFHWTDFEEHQVGHGEGEHNGGGHGTVPSGEAHGSAGAVPSVKLVVDQSFNATSEPWDSVCPNVQGGVPPADSKNILGGAIRFQGIDSELQPRDAEVAFVPSGHVLHPEDIREGTTYYGNDVIIPRSMARLASADKKAESPWLAQGHAPREPAHEERPPVWELETEHGAYEAPGVGVDKAVIFKNIPELPAWMFWCALITAYVTPFYMMRAWWMTFAGKPRDAHVHHHAHEMPLMYVPLVVLAVGTFVASYFLFRPLIAAASPEGTAAAMVFALDGQAHTPAIQAAHVWLKTGVGFAFIAGFAIAIAIYARGLGLAQSIARAIWPVHTLLEKKYFFDELYDFAIVSGGLLLSRIARLLDGALDTIFDLAAGATVRAAMFSGWILDFHGVDGIVNGIAKTARDIGNTLRQPQTGRIRNYVLFAAGAAAIVLLVLVLWNLSGSTSAVAAAVN